MAVWFITGVSAGLGRALAAAALERGDAVHGTVRSPAAADAFAALGPAASPVMLDVTDEAALTTAIHAAGPIDILVNNAGYGLAGAVEEVGLAEARAQFEVNVFAPLAAIRAALPGMRARKSGHVINITSVSGIAVWPGTGVYCASKFALEAIGRALRDEVQEFGIAVTNVAPGGMRTDYAGRSLVKPAMPVAAYDGGVGHAAQDILADHAGHEPGDPARAAAAILAIAGRADAPRHLLLGTDALHYAERELELIEADIAAHRQVSRSIAFPGEGAA